MQLLCVAPMALSSSRQAIPQRPHHSKRYENLQSFCPKYATRSAGQRRNYCGAVLVVMEHWNVHFFLKPLFDNKALRCLDVLKVDAAKGWPISLTALIKASVSSVSSSISIEFTSANRLNRNDLPSITGLDANAPRICRDCLTRNSHTGRIGQDKSRCVVIGTVAVISNLPGVGSR
ncbi:hypothetical protein GQR58_029677 [Nymphon striatum]|nr:hypothetical protein GQR58_029677 [Nymphon striatum]